MSVSNRNRRRVSLLASSSLVAASLLAGVAGLGSLVVAPGVALAADECGNPSANAGGNDVLTCAGAYVNIDYTATTNGNLTLNLEDGVTVTNGIAITGNAGETLTVRATTNVVGAGDPTVVNPVGYAINVQGQGPAVIVDLRSTDVGVDGLPGPAIGSGRGINATNSAGDTQVRLNEGAVNATAGFGINATSAGGGDTTVYLTNGATVTSTGTAVRAISSGGVVDVVTTGLLTSNNEGIFANGTAGVTISAGAINAGGTGISATSTGGAVDVTTTTGGVSGSTGIVTNSGSANPTTITLGDNVTGTAGAGISSTIGDADYTLTATGVAITGTGAQGVLVTSNGDGLITLNVSDVTGDDGIEIDAITGNNTVTVVSDGLITANNGVGVDVDSNGPVSVTVNDVTASGYGVIAVSANGASSVFVNGAVNGGGGVAAQSGGAANATVTLNAGSTVSGSDGFSYGAFAQATGTGDAIINVGGDVTEGGVGGFSTTGGVQVTGAGNVAMTLGFDAVEVVSTTGAITVNLTGDIDSSLDDAVDASSNTGAINVTLGGVVTAGSDGVEASSFSGAITVVLNGTVTAGGDGANLVTGGVGTVGVTVSGSVTGDDDGVSLITNGSGDATATILAGGAVATTNPAVGYGVFVTTNGSGDAIVVNDGAVTEGGIGAFALSTGDVDVSGSGSTSVTGAFAAIDTFSNTGATDINLTGAITSTGGDGINALSNSGAITVSTSGAINAGQDGIDVATLAGGAVSVSGSSTIDASGGYGINAQTQGGDITVLYTGDIGSTLDPTALGGINAVINAGSGAINVTAVNDINTLGTGVSGSNLGTAGAVNVGYQGTLVAGPTGVSANIGGAANADTATVVIGDGSTITAGTVGVSSTNSGTGAAVTLIGAGVTIDPTDYGSFTSSAANDATVSVGNNAVIVVANTDGDGIATGVFATSGQAADDAVGDESTEILLGSGLSITIDDGAAGDADGASGVVGEATGAAGSVAIVAFDGLNISVTGNSAVGVAGSSVGGDITILTGTGTIDILGLDNVDGAGNFPGSAGIGALSTGGDIFVQSATTISVNNGSLSAAGIFASTTGAGTVTISNTGQILSSDVGIGAVGVDGFISVNNSAFVGAVNNGIDVESNGTGGAEVINTGAITSLSASGISIVNAGAGGTVFASNTGTLNVSFDGIQVINTNAAGTGIVQVTNTGAINANLGGGGGFGIFASQAGTGGVLINNSGAISGSADSGIVAADTAASGGITILNTGAIGSSADPVTTVGILAAATSGASINIQSTGGAIWAGDVGIRANSTSTGDVQISTTGGSVNADANPASVGIWANSDGGFVQIANNVAVNSAGTGILATNTTGSVSVGTSGVVTATANDAIRTSTTTGANTVFTVAGGNLVSTSGDGIDASSTTGAIDIDTVGTITAGGAGITATATGAGVITIDTTAASTISATGDGIFASSAGGNVTVTNNATVSGGADGIQTVNSGTGVSTLNVNANVTATGAGASALNAVTTGTGAVNVLVANGRTIQDVNGSAIRTGSGGGAVTVNTGTGSTIVGSGSGASGWVVDLNNAAGGTTTLNVGASTTVRSTDNTITGYDDNAIRGVGGSVVLNNAGRINGRVSFSGLTGNVVFNNSSLTSWHTTGASTFSGGADVLNNTGAIFTNAGGAATSFDFGAGADTFTQAGLLVVGEPTLGASTLTITNLEAFNNSGRIVFGSSGTNLSAVSDGATDDRILASGATFTGSGSSLLAMDAFLGATTQTSCGTLTAADCLSLTGGSTAGSTSILVNDTNAAIFGAFNPTGIVLVDVAGAGSTAATHFSLNSGSDYWRADLNSADGVLDKGLFFYDLTLNGNKQHVLVGLPDSEAFEFTTFGAALTDIWRTTTGTWFERQADLRTQLPSLDDSGAAVWMKISGAAAERDRIQGYDLFGVSYDFDTSYAQDTISLIGGLDFVGGGSGKAWVVGGQIGYVDSDVTFDNSPSVTSFEGMTFGLYGSYISGPWFVDAIVNANSLDYDHQAITLNPAGPNIYSGSADTLGFQVEGGWSMPIGANGFFEPLASLSYVSSDIDAVDVPGATVEFDDVTSLRASLGGRVGLTADHGTFSSKWALVARYWNEFEGENDVNFVSGPGFTLSDDFSGSFGEVGGTVNVFGADDRFSAFLNLGVKFQDDYQSTEGSLGLRWRW